MCGFSQYLFSFSDVTIFHSQASFDLQFSSPPYTKMASSSSAPKIVPPRFPVSQPKWGSGSPMIVKPPPRVLKSSVDQMTMYGTSLPAAVTKAEVMLHCLAWCGVKPVADLITIMRPSGGSQYSSCVVGWDSQVVCSRAIAKLDRLPFEGSNDPKPCSWKLARVRAKPRAGPVFRRQQWQDELSPVSPPAEPSPVSPPAEPSPVTPETGQPPQTAWKDFPAPPTAWVDYEWRGGVKIVAKPPRPSAAPDLDILNDEEI